MNTYSVASLVLLLIISTLLSANEFQIRLLPTYIQENEASLFALNASNERHRLRTEWEWQGKQSSFVWNAALVTENGEDVNPDVDLQLNEAFYEGEWREWDVSVGKKLLDWGIAWGFRPLDTLQETPRLTLHPVMLEGVPHFSLEHFGETSSVALIVSADLDWQAAKLYDADLLGTLRLFKLQGDYEWLGLLAWGEGGQTQLGGGFSRIVGDHWKFYAELLYERDYSRWQNRLLEMGQLTATQDPMYLRVEQDALQGVLGFTWTGTNKLSFLAEYVYDGRAYTDTDWQALRDLAQRQQVFFMQNPSAIPMAIADQLLRANQQAYNVPNILRDSLIMQLSYDGETYATALESVFTPEDQGGVLTFKITRNLARQQSLQLGMRGYLGGQDSAFANLVETPVFFATWQGRW